MFEAALLLVFREMIEAGLIVGIVLGATRGIPRRGRYIVGGIAGGLLGAALVAVFAGQLGNAFEGMGREVFNAAILLFAVLMLAWHNIWMAHHGKQLAREMKAVGEDVSFGKKSLMALAIVVGIAVLREGSEVVLFMYGLAAADASKNMAMLQGGAVGVVLGVALSALMYAGLLRIPLRYFFRATGMMITLLAAGLAAKAVHLLQQAGFINLWQKKLWDTSHLLSDSSVFGEMLHVLVGYSDKPNGLQVLVYVLTITVITLLTRHMAERHTPVPKAQM